jgi:signal transduction histidine kinase
VAIAERNAVRLMALINDILDLERLETGTIELRFAEVPVESILRRAMESLTASGHQPGIAVEVPEASSTIWADAEHLLAGRRRSDHRVHRALRGRRTR